MWDMGDKVLLGHVFSPNTVEFPFKIHLRDKVLNLTSRNILQAGCVKSKQKNYYHD